MPKNLLSAFLMFLFAQVACGDVIIYEQTRIGQPQALSGTLAFNQYSLQTGETLQKVEIEYLNSAAFQVTGRNESTSNYTVTATLNGLFRLQSPAVGVSPPQFSDTLQIFAPRNQTVSGSFAGLFYSGVSTPNQNTAGYANYLGSGTFNVTYNWLLNVSVDRTTFSFRVDPVGMVNTVTVRHYINVVPEPSCRLAVCLAACAILSSWRGRFGVARAVCQCKTTWA